MLVLPKKTSHPLHTDSILEINRVTSRAEDYTGIHNINRVTQSESLSSAEAAPFTVSRASETPMSSRVSNPLPSYRRSAQQNTFTSSAPSGISHQIMPALINQTRKGQKTLLGDAISLGKIKACLGWNVKNPACDVDVSAFLLGRDGKVSGDDWFVFYGQKESPDCSVIFSDRENTDRESVAIDLSRLNPSITRIVFVLTINDAFSKRLNFGMIEDAYVRILDAASDRELVSFVMDEYYSNVISMMIGEVYLHNGNWKFNAIGNGVAKDLEGLCDLYGVQVKQT